MTPKQKAEQLIALFEITAHPTIDMDKQISKTCALKCVNQIMELDSIEINKNNGYILIPVDNDTPFTEFWTNVKAEIER